MHDTRTLRFPDDRSLGRLVVAPPGYRAAPWEPHYIPPIPAQGIVAVPVGMEVRLHLRFADQRIVDLSPLTGLAPDALDHLTLDSCDAGDAELRHLEHLAGLSRLYLRDTRTTDAGLVHLGRLLGLDVLVLDYLDVSDAGLMHLQQLTRLRRLELESTLVTPSGVEWLRDVLPGCDIRYEPRRPRRRQQ